MVLIDVTHTFPVSVSDAFTYITDLKNWSEYWPDFVRIQDPVNAHWSKPGDKVTIVIKFLNRERELNLILDEFQKEALVTYRSYQNSLPDTHHERHFKEIPGGIEYRLIVAYEPRKGMTGLFDRLFVKRAVERAVHKTVENLDKQLNPQRQQG